MRLSSYSIKLIAFALMVIDHAGRIFLPGLWLPIAIGRLSYPLFAWLAAEGQQKSSNVLKYMGRLVLWGFISQPFYAYFCHLVGQPPQLNILFTLALGVAAIAIWRRTNHYIGLPVLFVGLVLSTVLHVAGGAYAVSIIYLMSEIRYRSWWWHIGFAGTVLTFTVMYGFSPVEVFGIFSSLILMFYSGLQGKRTKVFYLLYPAHFAGLIAMQRAIVG